MFLISQQEKLTAGQPYKITACKMDKSCPCGDGFDHEIELLQHIKTKEIKAALCSCGWSFCDSNILDLSPKDVWLKMLKTIKRT